ncbi:TetR/AcrR family transcriptional regulator [Sulfitobacter sp. SK012]|uniref:TetR/AcrR family transcriptional regulator n=1 Tax=Sulfitobacter sp. SK012 TaxID=1389005 RepID=UPI000E0A2B0E|nr:TetR/AcrR family transcriptional regulator [Sulfitobacter sp. SK012]AXI48067.1 TetR/AcrR family transcriptional regulator [Sulfitobacter sp. SK012]
MKYAKPYDRAAALNAALFLFWERGFHATSIKDLEDALKMRSGSIYAAFKSKENLYALALEQYFQNSQNAFEKDVLEAQSPLAGLVAMIRRISQADDILRRPCMLIKAVINATDDTAEIAGIARDYRKRMVENMVQGFEKARQLGELQSNSEPKALASQYQTDVIGLQVEAQMGADTQHFANRVEETARRYERLQVMNLSGIS